VGSEKITVIVKPIVFVFAALIVLAALWFFFKPQRPEPPALIGAAPTAVNALPATTAPVATPGQAVQSLSAGNNVFELVVRGGQPVSGPRVLQVHEGEQVILNIRSDSSDELHLHGYDLHARITPGQTTSLQFTANRTGRFGLELHQAHTELGALEVYPR
jgi:heme/copper-type cytochrome/quinol oxidase subunit 2